MVHATFEDDLNKIIEEHTGHEERKVFINYLV